MEGGRGSNKGERGRMGPGMGSSDGNGVRQRGMGSDKGRTGLKRERSGVNEVGRG